MNIVFLLLEGSTVSIIGTIYFSQWEICSSCQESGLKSGFSESVKDAQRTLMSTVSLCASAFIHLIKTSSMHLKFDCYFLKFIQDLNEVHDWVLCLPGMTVFVIFGVQYSQNVS